MKTYTLLALLVMIIAVFAVSGCTGKTETAAFVGGTDALKMSFVDLPETIFANVPFQLAIIVQNAGEAPILKEGATFTLNNANNFNIWNPVAHNNVNLPAAKRINNTIIPGGQEFINWGPAKFTGQAGVPLTEEQKVPIFVEACYPYSTTMLTMACVARDTRDCNPAGEKTAQSSGGPIQIKSFKQVAQEIDDANVALNFIIEIENKGKDDIFSINAGCPGPSAAEQNYVAITAINFGGRPYSVSNCNDPTISLFEGKGSASCSIIVPTKTNFEDELFMTLNYTFRQRLTTEIAVIPP
jgi:hypothetical protein